jgi:hypothetical protein
MDRSKEFPEYKENEAHWRCAANENMAYTDIYPEALLTLPEAWDGSIADGQATLVKTNIYLKGSRGTLIIEDNGVGICTDASLKRMLSWSSTDSTSSNHRYGHGSKTMLTKWMKIFDKARWMLEYRSKSVRGKGHTNDMVELKAPFLGMTTPKRLTEDGTNLCPSGLRWTIEFDVEEVLGKAFSDPNTLFNALKELVCTRYSRAILNKTTFEINVFVGEALKKSANSAHWLTFKEALEREVRNNNAYISRGPKRAPLKEGGSEYWEATEYTLKVDSGLAKDFPTHGLRNMFCTRVHMGINGRYIEAMKMADLLNREPHNSTNGRISVVDFMSDDKNYDKLPTPATTKVAFSEGCVIFSSFKKHFTPFLQGPENELPKPKQAKVDLKYEDIITLKLDSLKEWCEHFKIPKTGNKAELVGRLQEKVQPGRAKKDNDENEAALAKAKEEEAKSKALKNSRTASTKESEALAEKERQALAKAQAEKEAQALAKALAEKDALASAEKERQALAKALAEKERQALTKALAEKDALASAEKERQALAKDSAEKERQALAKALAEKEAQASAERERQALAEKEAHALEQKRQFPPPHTNAYDCGKNEISVYLEGKLETKVKVIVDETLQISLLDSVRDKYGVAKFQKWLTLFNEANRKLETPS